jgi:putative transposase
MGNTMTNLVYHMVFNTKHRDPITESAFEKSLYSYIGGIIREEGAVLMEAGAMPDHIHLLARLKPVHSVAGFLKIVKSKSSKWVNEKLSPTKFHWQTGYGAFTVSASQIPTVKKYIQNQEQRCHRKSYQDEFLDLVKRHDIE